MQLPGYYQDPTALHIGTQPPRAYYLPAAGRAGASNTARTDNERFTLLNGIWNFTYYTAPEQVPEAFWTMPQLDTMPVPGVWQHNGYDQAQYTNTKYPFPFDPPFVPRNNPCGAYVRTFTVTAAQKNLRQYLNFEGVDSCYYVWVNGVFVGYDQVAHCTGEFDITDAVTEGENTLAVLVLKWCDGSYIEDQDKFRCSGIFRDVYILHRPAQHLRDYTVRTLPAGEDMQLSLTFDWAGEAAPLHLHLTGPDGLTVWTAETTDAAVSVCLPGVQLWNAENPVLYTLWMETKTETVCEKIGFRYITADGGVLRINGQTVKFRGVNRHDSDPFVGSAVDRAHLIRDLSIMKQHNINAIRTSHYPNAPYMTQLCDELGFYVIDEADQEAHGCVNAYNDSTHFCDLADEPTYLEEFRDRAVLLLQRDKNRPCVIMWSAGNESGWGRNTEAELAYFKQNDPTRITHYESEWMFPKDFKQDLSDLDTYSQMYPSLARMEEVLTDPDRRQIPYVLCEYCHAMGNGPGDLEDYFQMFDKHPRSCGGFIWEWCDHAVYAGVAENGKPKFYYGGDSGEALHDGNFCMDGLVYPDRRVHTGLLEYKNVIRPGRISRTETGWAVTNIMDFTDLANYADLRWEMTVAGEVVASGAAALPSVAPHATVPLAVELPAATLPDTWVRFILLRKHNAWFAAAGQELGFDQHCLIPAVLTAAPAVAGSLSVTQADGFVTVTGEGVYYRFNEAAAVFDAVEVGENKLLAPMSYTIWRAPTDNDRNIKEKWYTFHYDRAYTYGYNTAVSEENGCVIIRSDFALVSDGIAWLVKGVCDWRIAPDGALSVSMELRRNTLLPEFPRFGLHIELPGCVDHVRYLGYGPHESYIDKHRASWYGLFGSTVAQQHEDYTRPQENGSHWNCTSLRLAGESGGLKVEAVGAPFSFNASPYTAKQLTEIAHNYELVPTGRTVLTLDYRQDGIGSNSCGPVLEEKYRLDEENIKWAFRLSWL